VTIRNTGASAAVPAEAHPQDAAPFLSSDMYRLALSVDGAGWTSELTNALAGVKFGEPATIPVHVSHASDAAGAATITLTAVSESDATRRARAV
jgi:hypothetical protein